MTRILGSLALAVVCIFACAAATAQPIVLPNLPDGVYIVTVAGPSITVDKPRQPGVSPVPDDPDPAPSEWQQQIREAAAGAVADPQRAVTAANLAGLMDLIQSQIAAGTLQDYQSIAGAVNWMFDQLTIGREAPWKPLKSLLGAHLTALAQQGAQPEEYSGYFSDVSDSLSGSLSESDMLAADDSDLRIDIAMLMQLFEFFIKYVLPLL